LKFQEKTEVLGKNKSFKKKTKASGKSDFKKK
jgi:hypothetical protein